MGKDNFQTVSVVIPTYNRAHILHITIPTYIQENVCEVILVDDASTDNTQEVVTELQKKYPKIRYVRNEVNSKQTYSKNVGINLACGEYIYFGDDDSVITEGCISTLLQTMQKYEAEVVAARSIYADSSFNVRYIDTYLRCLSLWKNVKATSVSEIINLKNFSADFEKVNEVPIVVPFCQACALVDAEIAKHTLFDVKYTGCAYREETDFFIRISLQGKKIMYDSKAAQINLPKCQVRGGGAHYGSADEWYESAKENNWYFLSKNWDEIRENYGLPFSAEEMQETFVRELAYRKSTESKRTFLFMKTIVKKTMMFFMILLYRIKSGSKIS